MTGRRRRMIIGRVTGPLSLSVVLLVALSVAPRARAASDDRTVWKATPRDVYVDGRLDRGVVVVRSANPPALMVLRDRAATSAWVIDLESLEVRGATVDEPTFGESGWETRTSGKQPAPSRGTAKAIDDSTLLVALPEGVLVIAPHAGVSGPTSRDEIFGLVPTWKELYERHEPDAAVVRTLAAIEQDVRLTLAFGTWCGDSRREVPRLLKALDEAANAHLRLELVALSRDFDDPVDLIRERRLTNVPTLVVSRGGEEIGRIVETPAGESLAADLAQILMHEPLLHTGRWARSARVARGRYAIVDASGGDRGVEDWELFSDSEGGTLLYARTGRAAGVTEVWHRRDAEGRSTFVEITRTNGSWHSRSRLWIRAADGAAGRELRTLTRGNGTGVIRQNAILDDGVVIVSPCVADLGRAAALAAVAQGPARRPAMLLGGAGDAATGRLGSLELAPRSPLSVTTSAGTFVAHHVAGRFDGAHVDAWLHDDLGLPVRWQRSGGDEALLTELETFPPAGSDPTESETEP